ncbi:hypothetical protein GCM10010336_21670 [Streptomyces goshikiensis]|nr:hypothetical protein GCM10010336_21670 [Streptomyces goshikiensis]
MDRRHPRQGAPAHGRGMGFRKSPTPALRSGAPTGLVRPAIGWRPPSNCRTTRAIRTDVRSEEQSRNQNADRIRNHTPAAPDHIRAHPLPSTGMTGPRTVRVRLFSTRRTVMQWTQTHPGGPPATTGRRAASGGGKGHQ